MLVRRGRSSDHGDPEFAIREAGVVPVPDASHALFSLDPKDFVTARDQLAKKLQQEGDKEQAKTVKALRRPTIPIWALNQVARERPDEIDALITASSQAHAAQDKDVRNALSVRRDRMHDVLVLTRQMIDGSGRGADQHELDITSALSTILTSDELTRDLRDGVLTQVAEGAPDIEWPDVSGTPLPTGPTRELMRAREELERRRVAADDAAMRVADAQRIRDAAQDALERAEAEVARLEA